MRVLVVGGSGFVGRMTLPYLAERHEVRVLDLAEPTPGPWDYVQGSACDFDAVQAAAEGTDALVYMAMGPVQGWGSADNAAWHFDASVKGLYLSLWAARDVGVVHAVYTSSMSVYQVRGEGGSHPDRYPDEGTPPNADQFYGLTKRLGEEVCQAAVRERGMSIVALRLCLPTPDDQWPRPGSLHHKTIATSARDTARAILAALDHRGCGFEAAAISGDAAERIVPVGKAKQLLGWEPLDRTDLDRTDLGPMSPDRKGEEGR